jgi:hypothetical protein
MGNVISALEHRDRVQRIFLEPISSQVEGLDTVMQEAFPALTHLFLELFDENPPPIPATFLAGSAPRLQLLDLYGISFPTLPKLLLSISDLVNLSLSAISNTGYISPEAMARGLSALSRLERLSIGFKSPVSRPDLRSRRPPPLTPAILPALISLFFRGVSEYLEDLVAQIDALNFYLST